MRSSGARSADSYRMVECSSDLSEMRPSYITKVVYSTRCCSPEVEHAQGAVGAHGAEDVPARGEGDVVHLLVVRDQLRLRRHRLHSDISFFTTTAAAELHKRRTVKSQMVQVVSMEHEPSTEASASFQSKLVRGAQYSEI